MPMDTAFTMLVDAETRVECFHATSGSIDKYTLSDLPNPDSYTISIVATSDGFPSEIVMVTGVIVCKFS